MTDINSAFEVESGFLKENGPFFTGGTSSPVGLDLPENTLYSQTTVAGVVLWQKVGPLSTEWVIYQAKNISFSSSQGLTSTNVNEAIDEAFTSNTNVFGRDFFENTTQFNDSTTGNTFKIYDTGSFTVTDTTTNKYRISSEFTWGHNSAANDIRVQLLVDGIIIEEMRVEPKDSGADQRIKNTITGYLNNLSVGSHTYTLRYRPATANRVSRMYRSVIEVWRVN